MRARIWLDLRHINSAKYAIRRFHRVEAPTYNKDMPINLILFALITTTAVLAALCAWLYWRTRRLQSLLETRHAFEELIEQRERPAPRFTPSMAQTMPLQPEPDPVPDAIAQAPAAQDSDEGFVQPLLLELDPLDDEGPAAASLESPAPAPGRQARPVVLGVISHKGGTGKTTTALELARSWIRQADGSARRILLVDTDPVQAAATLLGLEPPAPGEIQACPQEGLFYVHWLPAGWPHPARWPESFLSGWDVVVVDTPSLQNPLTVQLLPLFNALLMTLTLEPASMRVLEQGAILLERRLDPHRQRLLGVLVTRYQPDAALQTSLYASLQREYVGILLPETIPEDPSAWNESLLEQVSGAPAAYRLAYRELAERLYAQLQPLKERAGGQA